jgi:hypothetical protein
MRPRPIIPSCITCPRLSFHVPDQAVCAIRHGYQHCVAAPTIPVAILSGNRRRRASHPNTPARPASGMFLIRFLHAGASGLKITAHFVSLPQTSGMTR